MTMRMTMIHKREEALAGWRVAWPSVRGRGIGAGPGFDILAAHINPGRVWQVSGKPGC